MLISRRAKVVSAVAVVVVCGAMIIAVVAAGRHAPDASGRIRVGENGDAFWGREWAYVRWRLPGGHPVLDLARRQSGRLVLGPCRVEIRDIHGTVYGRIQEVMPLFVGGDGGIFVQFTFSPHPDESSKVGSDGQRYDSQTGRLVGWGPTDKNGRIFNIASDSPVTMKVELPGGFYCRWQRTSDEPNRPG